MESPSFLGALVRFPGAIIRFPSAAVDTLDALNELAERIDHLLELLEPFQGGFDLAGTGMHVATGGIAQALTGLQQAIERLDRTAPGPFGAATAQLRILSERLNGTTSGPVDVTAVRDDPSHLETETDPADAHSAGSKGAGPMDPPLVELELSMTELAHSLDSLVGAIPLLRQVIRVTASAAPDVETDDQE